MAALFPLGQITATPGALQAMVNTGTNPVVLLDRHVSVDWGEIPAEDAAENRMSLQHGFRIISSYSLSSGERVWIVTEADRSLTTLLLPGEY